MTSLTTAELCRALRVSSATLQRWRRDGLPHIQIQKTVRYPIKEVAEWLCKTNTPDIEKHLKAQEVKRLIGLLTSGVENG